MNRLIQRDAYLNRLVDKRGNGLIKVITGIRRCGKSYLLFYLFKDYLLKSGLTEAQIISVALDDDTCLQYRDPEVLSQYVRSRIRDERQYVVLIDEIQYGISKTELENPDAIRLYNVLNGLMRLQNVDIYVTGSNSKLLSQDVMTAFRGRGDQIEVFPLSFKEYFDFVGGDKIEAYEAYALYGGMPQLMTFRRDEEKEDYLKRLFTEVYFKDIVERYKIQLPEVLQNVTDNLCSSIGSLTNAKKLSDTLTSVKGTKVAPVTIGSYLNCLTESFLFNEAKRYDVKGKKYFSYPVKYYCVDVGLRNARLNFRQQEETHLMENIIYNELRARGYSVDVGVIETVTCTNGTKTKKQCEIDFVVNRGAKRYYIQSALSVREPEKLQAELRPLKHTKDFFKKLLIPKTTERPWLDDDGIVHIGLYDFLLDRDSLNIF